VYNVRAQRWQASAAPGTDERVHITIAPRSAPGTGKSEAAQPPDRKPGKDESASPKPTAQP